MGWVWIVSEWGEVLSTFQCLWLAQLHSLSIILCTGFASTGDRLFLSSTLLRRIRRSRWVASVDRLLKFSLTRKGKELHLANQRVMRISSFVWFYNFVYTDHHSAGATFVRAFLVEDLNVSLSFMGLAIAAANVANILTWVVAINVVNILTWVIAINLTFDLNPQPPLCALSQQETWGGQLHCTWCHNRSGAFSFKD